MNRLERVVLYALCTAFALMALDIAIVMFTG
jgi:hypothetical protein